MDIQNSKFDSNTYLNFAINSRALPNVILNQAKYYFKGWEVKKNPKFKQFANQS